MQRKTFRGGYRFGDFNNQPESRVLAAKIPPAVSVPIAGPSAVEVGVDVHVGTPLVVIDDDAGPRRPCVSPAAGRVTSVDHGTIRIETSGSQDWTAAPTHTPEWENLSSEAIEEILVETASTAVCAGGIPTTRRTADLSPDSVRDVIVYHPAADVFVSPLEAILAERTSADIAIGVAILNRLMPDAVFHLVLGRENRLELEAAVKDARAGGVELVPHTGDRNYPQYHEAMLVRTATGREVPEGQRPADVGAVLVDVAGLLQVVDAVTRGKPYIERIVALAGPGFAETPHVRARFGTPVSVVADSYLNRDGGARIICNSVMTGREVEQPDEPLSPECAMLIALPEADVEILPFMSGGLHKDSVTRTFLAALFPGGKQADTNVHGDELACVSCTYCEQVCPVGILPYHLHRYVQRDVIDEDLVRYGAFRCIDCNLCTYVCPSKIPLARLIAEGKTKLLDEGFLPIGQIAPATSDQVRSEGDAV